MRVFVTGATGFIGSAVVPELIRAGHTVIGLARSDAGAESLVNAGAEVQRGTLEDLDVLHSAAKDSDGVIHLAFIHDFSQMERNAAIDRAAIETMLDALAGSGKPFVGTSGTLVAGSNQLATEDQPGATVGAGSYRALSEEIVLNAADRGVRSSVIRLSPSVHGVGDHGFIPMIIGCARQHGQSAYIGEGTNRWPAVHRLDAAVLYRLAVEKAPAGSRLHGVADEGVPIREIAEVIGRRLNLPVVSLTGEKAAEHFTWMAHFLSPDSPASSKITRELLGWDPVHPGLLEDIDSDHYFPGT